MNYEHNDEFEQLPGSDQGTGSQGRPERRPQERRPGTGRPQTRGTGGIPGKAAGGQRSPQRTSAGKGQRKGDYGREPVRREGAKTTESSRQSSGPRPGAEPGSGKGRLPGAGRQPGDLAGNGSQAGRTVVGGSQEANAFGTRSQPRGASGAGRGARESGEGRRQTGRVPEIGRQSGGPGGAGNGYGPGRMPRTVGQPGETDRTGNGYQPGRVSGNGRLSESRQSAGTGRRIDGEQQSRLAENRDMSAVRIAAKETAAGREADSREDAGSTGRNRKTADTKGVTGNPREVLAQAKIQKAKKRRRTRRLIAMIVAECLMLTVIFTYAYFARRLNMIQREDFNKEDVKNSELSLDDLTKMKGYWMIAVFGVDSRSTSVGAGNQADVNMICCINQDTGDIKLVSVYRDTYLNINDSNSYRKLNAAYANGGPEQALKALNKNLDLDITDYITFSWKAVAQGINILGGVDVEITRPEFKYINAFISETVQATNLGSHQLQAPGFQHLDGVQAVAYGRLRLMDTDYARTERQRKIIELAFAKAKQADYVALNNILVTTLPSVSTNLDFADLTSLALNISKYHISETTGFPFAKGNANMPGKGDCVIPQTLESNVSQLHTFLFGDENYTPTDQVKQISGKIADDSGMHREGKPSTGSALVTDSYVPTETAVEKTTKAQIPEESSRIDETEESRTGETDENGNMILYPNQTDENGDLIDAPIDDWPEEVGPIYPGGQNNNPGTGPQGQGNSVRPGETQGQTPGRPTESSAVHDPGTGRTPGSESRPGGSYQPSGGSQTPGGNQGPGSGTGNSGVTPGGNSSPGTTPAGNTSPGNVGSGNSSSGENGGPGSSQQPSGGQTSSQPSQSGQTPGQPSQSGQTPGQPSQNGQPSQSGQTPGQSSSSQTPGGQSSGQSGDAGGPGAERGPGV